MNTKTNIFNNNSMKPFIYTAFVALMLASCAPAETEETSAIETQNNERVTNISTLNVSPVKFEHFFNVQGVVETDQNAQIFPEAAGKITSIKVKEGDKVSKGQVLMTIDSRIVSNQIDELKSRLGLVEVLFKKQEKLWNQNIGSEIQFLEAKNNFESLKQNLETLEAQRSLYTINAPFGGVIDEINPKEGEMANPGVPAMRLINTDKMYIKADITERYLGQVKEGDLVMINFPGVEEKMNSKIGRIASFINPNNRSFKIKLDLDNKSGKLKPNMLGEMQVRDYVNDSTIVIPTSLIQMTPTGEEFVYLVEQKDGKAMAKKQTIKSGMNYENNSEILEGLNGYEVLINKGARSIKDGDVVNIEG
jgi:membrane fusion protein, multidrug efflux system